MKRLAPAGGCSVLICSRKRDKDQRLGITPTKVLQSELELPYAVFIDDFDAEAINCRHEAFLNLGDAALRKFQTLLHARVRVMVSKTAEGC